MIAFGAAMWQRVGRFAARPWTIIIPGTAGALLRIGLLPWVPFPAPGAGDEFSYLLGADTFAHGRLTNPAHPLWRFFETVHVISLPTYASKYPPGQAFFLAIGERFLGHPFFGVILSYVLFMAALVWMLRAWMPAGVAFVTGCCAAIVFGVGHGWLESYWGGDVSGAGAALVLGAIGRIRAQGRFGFAWPLALGLVLLWFTRPFEGIFFVVGAAALLLLDVVRHRIDGGLGPFTLVLIGCCVVTLSFQGYYDWRVTRHPMLLPYVLHERQYDYEPPLWIEQPLHPTFDAGPAVHNFHALQEFGQYRDHRHLMSGWLTHEPGSGRNMPTEMKEKIKLLEMALVLPVLAGFTLWRRSDADVRALVFVVAIAAIPFGLETYIMDHYMGPLMVALIALTARVIWLSWGVASASFAGLLMILALGNNGFRAWRAVHGSIPFKVDRPRIQRELQQRESRQVVFVRYAADHDAINPVEWVYNGADIDGEHVVWARDRGVVENRRLIAYYAGRHFWIVNADAGHPEPTPYLDTLAAP